jgi:hypothetical protein
MATTTPNFGWPVPTSTDLVKNGATAIEALGDAIDASLVDLEGGTTGQVLAKASNTDMDFAWVAQDDSNAIQNSIVDAKGDLISATANDTPARLAVGNNGETLVADSSTSTGLRYQAPVQANPVINSAMQIAQRGTSISVGTGAPYTLDRWQGFRGGAAAGETVSRQVTGDTTNLPFIQYCARVQRDSGNTSTADVYFTQNFETINTIPFAGKTVTISFYARRGANFSASGNTMTSIVYVGTGTDQNWISGYTGFAAVFSQANTLTTTWQRFSMTGTIPATATEMAINLFYAPTGTAGAADFYEVTGVQLEVGSVATPFHTLGGTIQGELAACQRYYWRSSPATAYGLYSWARGYSTTGGASLINFPVQMRIVPTSVDYSNLRISDTGTGGTAATSVSITAAESSTLAAQLDVASTTFRDEVMFVLQNNNNTAGYLGLSAEL